MILQNTGSFANTCGSIEWIGPTGHIFTRTAAGLTSLGFYDSVQPKLTATINSFRK